jgi:transposase
MFGAITARSTRAATFLVRPLRTTPKAIEKWFTDLPSARIAMEAGTHSIWISEQLQELGHEVIVANVRELRSISHSDRKSDQVDAEKLARFARLDPQILRPIAHRTVEQQEALTLIRARDLMVRLRTAAVNAVRGLTNACGHRMPASSTRCFAKRSLAVMPPGLVQALGPVLEQIADDTQDPRTHTVRVSETQALLKVQGVGHHNTDLRSNSGEQGTVQAKSGCRLLSRSATTTESVGRSRSSAQDHEGGNVYLRSLLIECANHTLRPQGKDSSLRRWVLQLADRGGKQAKNKAVVAVARKLKQY